MSVLEGKTAVITGGSSGIGFAAAKRFVAEGAFVFISGRRRPELDKAALRSYVRTWTTEVTDDMDETVPSRVPVDEITPDQMGQLYLEYTHRLNW